MQKIDDEEVQEADSYFTHANRSPYDGDPFHGGMYPQTIYFYYWDNVVDDEHVEPEPSSYIFEYPLPIRNKIRLAELIEEAAQKVADGQAGPYKTGFDKFPWQRKSFIVILIADPTWSFIEGTAIRFHTEKGGKGNHTFFDAFHPRVRVTIGGVASNLSALCFTNWMVDAYGNDLTDLQKEKFDFYLRIDGGSRGKRMADIDPGGTNLGPPIGPP